MDVQVHAQLGRVGGGEKRGDTIRRGERRVDMRFRDLAPRMLGFAFGLDKSVKTRPGLPVVAAVGGSLGETAFSFPAAFFFSSQE